MEYKIDETILNELVNYLAYKPYVETYQIIKKLQSLEKIEKKEE